MEKHLSPPGYRQVSSPILPLFRKLHSIQDLDGYHRGLNKHATLP